MDANWPELLQGYGPFALLPFTFFFIERMAAKRALDRHLPETTRMRVYAGAWIMIFALCGLVVTFWFLSRPAKQGEAMMRGNVRGLTFEQRFRGTSQDDTKNIRVYTYRDPQQANQVFWRAFSASPLDENTMLSFLIDNGTTESEETMSFPFRANPKCYSTELRFLYDRAKKSLLFENSPTGSPELLSGQPVVIASRPLARAHTLPWFGSVLAQSKASTANVLEGLEADDPLIRLSSRRQLAYLGPDALRLINQALGNIDSSYRLKLGAIVAANQMPGFQPNSLTPMAWCEVWRNTQTGDNTIRTQAGLLLKRQASPVDVGWCRQMQLRDLQRRNMEQLKAYRYSSK